VGWACGARAEAEGPGWDPGAAVRPAGAACGYVNRFCVAACAWCGAPNPRPAEAGAALSAARGSDGGATSAAQLARQVAFQLPGAGTGAEAVRLAAEAGRLAAGGAAGPGDPFDLGPAPTPAAAAAAARAAGGARAAPEPGAPGAALRAVALGGGGAPPERAQWEVGEGARAGGRGSRRKRQREGVGSAYVALLEALAATGRAAAGPGRWEGPGRRAVAAGASAAAEAAYAAVEGLLWARARALAGGGGGPPGRGPAGGDGAAGGLARALAGALAAQGASLLLPGQRPPWRLEAATLLPEAELAEGEEAAGDPAAPEGRRRLAAALRARFAPALEAAASACARGSLPALPAPGAGGPARPRAGCLRPAAPAGPPPAGAGAWAARGLGDAAAEVLGLAAAAGVPGDVLERAAGRLAAARDARRQRGAAPRRDSGD